MSEINMSSVQALRDFISERLTAAAVEIFTVFEQTIIQYEEEIHRQRELLDKPQIKLHTTDLLQQHICKEEEEEGEVIPEQLCHQERSSSLDQKEPELPQIKEDNEEPAPPQNKENLEEQEPPQIKEEPEELCTSQEGECFVLKLETETVMETSTDDESDHNEPDSEHLLSHNSPASCKSQDHRNNVDNSPMSESQCDTDTGKKSVVCNFCGKAFRNEYKLFRHRRIHTDDKPYSCEACGKSFRDNYTLSVHMRTHTDEKPYTCKTCGKCYKCRHGLVYHMRSHTGERPYVCKTCGKCYKHGSGLLYHMRIHTGEKLHSCKMCGKSFRQNSNLSVHMRTHTGEKPYSCEICGKRFSQQGHLLTHKKTHMGEKAQS